MYVCMSVLHNVCVTDFFIVNVLAGFTVCFACNDISLSMYINQC